MILLAKLQAAVGRLAALCLATAAADILLRDDEGALGFRALCRLTLTVAALKLLAGLLEGTA